MPRRPTSLPPSQTRLRQKFVEDLETLFCAALQKGNFAAALKAKELLGKEQGFLGKAHTKKPALTDLSSLSDEVLEHLITLCEAEESSTGGEAV